MEYKPTEKVPLGSKDDAWQQCTLRLSHLFEKISDFNRSCIALRCLMKDENCRKSHMSNFSCTEMKFQSSYEPIVPHIRQRSMNDCEILRLCWSFRAEYIGRYGAHVILNLLDHNLARFLSHDVCISLQSEKIIAHG